MKICTQCRRVERIEGDVVRLYICNDCISKAQCEVCGSKDDIRSDQFGNSICKLHRLEYMIDEFRVKAVRSSF